MFGLLAAKICSTQGTLFKVVIYSGKEVVAAIMLV
jgi:hypothetical protein